MQLRSILSHPAVYRLFTSIVGGARARTRFADDFIRARNGDRILDLGCGPADILAYLPSVDYVGVDASPAYIENAETRWGTRGRFICAPVGEAAAQSPGSFDIVLAVGVLHHLDDAEAAELFRVAHEALRPQGRLVTIDGVYVSGQSPIARYLLSKDRGHYVRSLPQYEHLSKGSFAATKFEVVDDFTKPIPYTHLVMECLK